jgi:hypothetical protein
MTRPIWPATADGTEGCGCLLAVSCWALPTASACFDGRARNGCCRRLGRHVCRCRLSQDRQFRPLKTNAQRCRAVPLGGHGAGRSQTTLRLRNCGEPLPPSGSRSELDRIAHAPRIAGSTLVRACVRPCARIHTGCALADGAAAAESALGVSPLGVYRVETVRFLLSVRQNTILIGRDEAWIVLLTSSCDEPSTGVAPWAALSKRAQAQRQRTRDARLPGYWQLRGNQGGLGCWRYSGKRQGTGSGQSGRAALGVVSAVLAAGHTAVAHQNLVRQVCKCVA